MSEETDIHPGLLKFMAFAFMGFALWTFSDATIRYLKEYPTVLVVCVAGSFSVLSLCIFAPFLGGFRETFTQPHLKLRLFRGAILACSNFLAFVAFANLELTKAYAIIFVAPLLTKILSVFLVGEQIRLRSWLITGLGFSGVLVVLRPGWVALDIGSVAALGLTFFFALGYVLSRYIGEEHQTVLSMSLFQYVFVTIGMLVPAYYAYQGLELSLWPLALASVVGFFSVGGSILVSRAFTSAPSAYIAPLHYTQILWGALLGAVLFNEYPDVWTLAGGAVIIIAGLLLIRYSRQV